MCGVNCEECYMKENCKGCVETQGSPFGGECILIGCCQDPENKTKLMEECKKTLIKEFNALGIKSMPEVTELTPLNGSFVNMEYTLSNGEKIKLLKDENIYLGAELPKENSDFCYGLAADNEYLLVCEYGNEGSNPKIVIYKKRDTNE